MNKYVEKNLENMKRDLAKVVSFNSVYSNDVEPFGSVNRQVLDTALSMMKENGFNTKNLDYYCGYGEVGKGNQLIGLVCHLDVVPAGDGWDSNPFEMVEKDGYLYGRGVSDDKGAAIASMYAIKYLVETGYEFKKRVRLILGCNEESGSACIKHYVEKEGHIDMGFTPDGNFPGIYAEKGMVSGKIVGHNTKIIDICGGDASNIVPKRVTAVVPCGQFDEKKFAEYLNGNSIEYSSEKENDTVKITVYGRAAHASMPELGINALSYLLEALYNADFNDDFVNYYHKYFSTTYNGELIGMEDLKDDVTNTTINIGVVKKNGNDIEATFDMRFPVKTTKEKVLEKVAILNEGNNEFVLRGALNPLYFDVNSPMIKALKNAYVTVTGDEESQMEAIGGGTYAKSINNCIAFGCEFQGEENHIHDANEKLSVESFKKQVLIYIEAIKNLNEA